MHGLIFLRFLVIWFWVCVLAGEQLAAKWEGGCESMQSLPWQQNTKMSSHSAHIKISHLLSTQHSDNICDRVFQTCLRHCLLKVVHCFCFVLSEHSVQSWVKFLCWAGWKMCVVLFWWKFCVVLSWWKSRSRAASLYAAAALFRWIETWHECVTCNCGVNTQMPPDLSKLCLYMYVLELQC